MEPEDRALFAHSLRSITDVHTGSGLDAALRELGWHDALSDDRHAAVELLFELQGSSNATSAALDDVLADALGVSGGGSIVLPPLGKTGPAATVANGRLRVTGLASAALAQRKSAVVAWESEGTRLGEIASERLDVHPVTGIDPALGLVEVRADLALDELTPTEAVSPWESAVASGQVALAHELVGAGRTMLRLAREHALDREQFGRPIAGFQAIRHRLAESLAALEAAQACVNAAWDADYATVGRQEALVAAALAKAVAGTTARTVGKHAQQVLGGMGYTTEHSPAPLHPAHARSRPAARLQQSAPARGRQAAAAQPGTARRAPALARDLSRADDRRAAKNVAQQVEAEERRARVSRNAK